MVQLVVFLQIVSPPDAGDARHQAVLHFLGHHGGKHAARQVAVRQQLLVIGEGGSPFTGLVCGIELGVDVEPSGRAPLAIRGSESACELSSRTDEAAGRN